MLDPVEFPHVIPGVCENPEVYGYGREKAMMMVMMMMMMMMMIA